MNIDRLNMLRSFMAKHEIDVYLVMSTDCHNSEYVPECFRRRSWISGFTGSAGDVFITKNHAYLVTDGRYFLQADLELDSKLYTLVKPEGFGITEAIINWIVNNLGVGCKIGFDPQVLSVSKFFQMNAAFSDNGLTMCPIDGNLVDLCKGGSITLPSNKAYSLDYQYTGLTTEDKLQSIRSDMNNFNAKYLVLNALDEIAWLLNIRGSDIEFNPLVISYMIVGLDKSWLFIDTNKLDDETINRLNACDIEIKPYYDFWNMLPTLIGNVWIDERIVNYAIFSVLANRGEILKSRSPIVLKKACKNSVELSGSINAHTRDAVAVISFLSWLDSNYQFGVNEQTCVDKIAEFRSMQDKFMGPSFSTISGFASNGAIIHYRVNPDTAKTIDNTSLFLIDSGGQYLDGTTDITRTVHLGAPTDAERLHYTLVLKGHLDLGGAVFIAGTRGESLDILARNALWKEGLNYNHGTGHGVGSFLCVHEGPQVISSMVNSNQSLLPGMIVSNEPGLYINQEYGIRIENLCAVVNVDQHSDFGIFYKFMDLTLVPYCKKLIDFSILEKHHIDQLKSYYEKIRNTILPLIDDINIRTWLLNELKI